MIFASVDYVPDVERMALYASICVSEKGIPNRIEATTVDARDVRDVITDDGVCFRFIAETPVISS
jgi:hypothetical protein